MHLGRRFILLAALATGAPVLTQQAAPAPRAAPPKSVTIRAAGLTMQLDYGDKTSIASLSVNGQQVIVLKITQWDEDTAAWTQSAGATQTRRSTQIKYRITQLSPNTTYTLRAGDRRRQYQTDAHGALSIQTISVPENINIHLTRDH
jgi:hypothetical protein